MQGEKKKGGEILEEDFTFAYEKFLMDCTLGSKINLIIRAEEINIKKKFFERLKKKCGAEEAKILLENAGEAADAFYLFFQMNSFIFFIKNHRLLFFQISQKTFIEITSWRSTADHCQLLRSKAAYW